MTAASVIEAAAAAAPSIAAGPTTLASSIGTLVEIGAACVAAYFIYTELKKRGKI